MNQRRRSPPRPQDWKKHASAIRPRICSSRIRPRRLLLLGHQLRSAEEKFQQLQTERNTLEQQTGFADERIAQLEDELAALSASVTEQQARRAAPRRRERTGADARGQRRSELLQTLRLAVATEQQRHENLVSQRQPMAAREAGIGRADRCPPRRHRELRAPPRTCRRSNPSRRKPRWNRRPRNWQRAEENVAAISQERSARLAAVNNLDAELRGIRNSLNELHDQRGKEQVRQTQLQLRVDNLLEHVTRRYQLDLREFAADPYGFQKTLRVQLKRAVTPRVDDADDEASGRGSEAEARELRRRPPEKSMQPSSKRSSPI